jgi:CheY-like chemotaxis protein
MEGKMWVESAVGQGSTFHFTVCLERSQTPVAPALVLPTQLQGLRVLVVDDNATNRCILHDLLSAWQMQPVLASSAQEALVLLHEACATGHAFPLILTDAHMPEMDGFTLVERIKHEPQLAGATIMMLTSSDQKGEKARGRELGISVYLIKPVRPSELLRAIRKALGQEGTATAQQKRAALPQKRQRPLHILLAEDNAVNQKLAVRLLEKQGHTVVVVGDGRKALAALTSDHFDVVLMDVQMPEADGLEATRMIRAREAEANAVSPTPAAHSSLVTHRSSPPRLPIIAMTAHAMKGDRERCLAVGMDDYVSKPLKPHDLFAALERVVTAAVHPLDAPFSLAHPADDKIADSVTL